MVRILTLPCEGSDNGEERSPVDYHGRCGSCCGERTQSRFGEAGRAMMKDTQHGLALMLVIWVLAIFMVVALSFSYATRTEISATLAFKSSQRNVFLQRVAWSGHLLKSCSAGNGSAPG